MYVSFLYILKKKMTEFNIEENAKENKFRKLIGSLIKVNGIDVSFNSSLIYFSRKYTKDAVLKKAKEIYEKLIEVVNVENVNSVILGVKDNIIEQRNIFIELIKKDDDRSELLTRGYRFNLYVTVEPEINAISISVSMYYNEDYYGFFSVLNDKESLEYNHEIRNKENNYYKEIMYLIKENTIFKRNNLNLDYVMFNYFYSLVIDKNNKYNII